ncbi:calcium permeable stress-gated cation channel 1 isoform X2 [Dromiciops gliroides]|uniref:calcium permeable stress-gated cation channel 1 isoform X2 n=1 Tax=Dromiciops gliroides TaxID=33562 RepID=UPI001CC7C6B7|nr:calcium permeable stress-gated cation channel 1 isoform X2 [Dromiciops gliroides]
MDQKAPESASHIALPMDILEVVESINNQSLDSCFHTRNTILRGQPFGGVPTVLILNICFWLVAICVYSFLRKAAWDYGRLGLLTNTESMISLFFGEQSDKNSPVDPTLEAQKKDTGYFSWMFNSIRMKKEELIKKCGDDAKMYLNFQTHLICLFLLLCVPSLTIILPINHSGHLLASNSHFGRTTIVNVGKSDKVLWVHSISSLFYFLITFCFMVHHGRGIKPKKEGKTTKTLMITYLPKDISDPAIIIKHFHEAYPSCTVTKVHFCYDLRKLIELDNQRHHAMKGRLYYTSNAQKNGKTMIRVHPCSRICFCQFCKCFKEVDAEQYYSELEERLTDEFNAERSRIHQKRLDAAFVTFQDENMTAVILKDFQWVHCGKTPQQSSVTSVVQSHKWRIFYAPHPKDILWEHLSIRGFYWWVRFLLLNTFLFILIFFLTTPSIVINTMDMFNVTRPIEKLKNPIVTQFISSVLMWAFAVTLPFIVYSSSFLEAHWTRSQRNLFTVYKCYFFLVFMVIILPSLGLTSLDLFFRWLFDSYFLDHAELKFQCVFLPDNGAFFVNYVITSSLIGTGSDLLRVESLLYYIIRLIFSKSEGERVNIRQRQVRTFEYGREYSWISCVISVVMAYSITCPIIVPFGLLYVCMKHITDKYNLYYTYAPTKLKEDFHMVGVYQVILAPLLSMFWLLFFSIVRLGSLHPITLFTLTILLAAIVTSFISLCFGKLWKRLPDSEAETSDTASGDFHLQRSISSSIFLYNEAGWEEVWHNGKRTGLKLPKTWVQVLPLTHAGCVILLSALGNATKSIH